MPNGKIQKYIVEYWPTDDPENVMNESRTDTSGKVSVKGLAGGTEYNFTVRAYTSRGAGELSSAVASTHKRLRK